MGGFYDFISPKRNERAQPTFRYELNITRIASILSLKAAACT